MPLGLGASPKALDSISDFPVTEHGLSWTIGLLSPLNGSFVYIRPFETRPFRIVCFVSSVSYPSVLYPSVLYPSVLYPSVLYPSARYHLFTAVRWAGSFLDNSLLSIFFFTPFSANPSSDPFLRKISLSRFDPSQPLLLIKRVSFESEHSPRGRPSLTRLI